MTESLDVNPTTAWPLAAMWARYRELRDCAGRAKAKQRRLAADAEGRSCPIDAANCIEDADTQARIAGATDEEAAAVLALALYGNPAAPDDYTAAFKFLREALDDMLGDLPAGPVQDRVARLERFVFELEMAWPARAIFPEPSAPAAEPGGGAKAGRRRKLRPD